MYIRNKWISLAWKSVLVIAGIVGLILGSKVLTGEFNADFPRMFTNLSNMLLVLYFAAAAIAQGRARETITFLPTLKRMIVMAGTITFLIAHFMLFNTLGTSDQAFFWGLILRHYVVPIMGILDLLLFDKKGSMRAWGPFAWILIPLAYFVGVEILVNVFGIPVSSSLDGAGNYPYPFLNAQEKGWAYVGQFVAVVLVAFIAMGYLWFAIDKLLAKIGSRK